MLPSTTFLEVRKMDSYRGVCFQAELTVLDLEVWDSNVWLQDFINDWERKIDVLL